MAEPGELQEQEVPHIRRNFVLGVINGALFMGSMRLLEPSTVLTLLVLRLMGSERYIGILAALTWIGWFLPSLIVSNIVEPQQRKMPWYHHTALFRILMRLALVAIFYTALPETRGPLTFWLVVTFMALESFGSGVAVVPFMDIVGKSIPATRRGAFFALRQGLSQVVGIAGGVLVAWLFANEGRGAGVGFPRNFAILFSITAAMVAVALGLFSLCHEPLRPVQHRRISFVQHLHRGRRLLGRNVAYRNFMILRYLSGLAAMALLFLTAFAKSELHIADRVVGAFVVTVSVASIFGNILWGWVSDHRGNRALLRGGITLAALPSVLGLVSAHLPRIAVTLPALGEQDVRVVLIALAFVAVGFIVPAQAVGEMNYILDLAPERRRSTWVGFSQLLRLPAALIPALGGAIAEISYVLLFLVSLAFWLPGTILAYTGIEEPRLSGTTRGLFARTRRQANH